MRMVLLPGILWELLASMYGMIRQLLILVSGVRRNGVGNLACLNTPHIPPPQLDVKYRLDHNVPSLKPLLCYKYSRRNTEACSGGLQISDLQRKRHLTPQSDELDSYISGSLAIRQGDIHPCLSNRWVCLVNGIEISRNYCRRVDRWLLPDTLRINGEDIQTSPKPTD